jgi:cysteinyl-tRNA synthetase
MPLVIYNSLTRKKEVFTPIQEGRVHMYVCGPTVYDYPHIGHAKSYITFDVVLRYLRYLGYQVRYVQNITDVGHLLDSGEDRILKGARRELLDPMELVERYTRAYFEAMDALNVIRPDISPRASGHIPEQIDLVQKLIGRGYAYESNGSVYFDVEKWPDYGKLSGRKVEEQQSGARVDINPEKRHPADFALWKKAEQGHLMQWKSPWGRGYPGWHAECSAMSMKYLGETFDIHGGGMENQFPHHECEIAQSEAATGKPFVNYWMHHNMVLSDGVKMSKSLGNFTTVAQALQKFSGEEIRFFILQTHYRNPVDFSDDYILAAAQGLKKLQTTQRHLHSRMQRAPEGDAATPAFDLANDFTARFRTEMDDDFNTPNAIGQMFEFSKEINRMLTVDEALSQGSISILVKTFSALTGEVLGLLPAGKEERLSAAPFVELLVSLRQELRGKKDWILSDRIRNELLALGVQIKDSQNRSEWEPLE